MRIEIAKVFDVIVIRLVGTFNEEIDLGKGIVRCHPLDTAAKVLINFHEVDYINSNGLRALAKLNQMLATKGGDLRLCSLPQNVRQLFKFAKLDNGYHIYNGEDEGISSFYNKFVNPDILALRVVYTG